MNREILVVEDTYVDMEFGTGVVKITPVMTQMTLRLAKGTICRLSIL